MNTNPNQNPPQGSGARTSVIRVALAGFAVVGSLVFGFLFLQSMRERDWAIAISTVVGALSVIPWASCRSSARDCFTGTLALAVGAFCGIGAVIGYLGLFPFEWFREVFASAVISGVISLLLLISSWRNVEFAIFTSTMGLDAISIARSGPDSSTFHDFVEELSRRIRQVKEADAS